MDQKTPTPHDDVALAVNVLAENVRALAQAQLEVAHHQRITNLIVLSQIIADPAEQVRLRAEAVARMNAPRRRASSAAQI